MADTLKTYTLECPGCIEDFTVELASEALADGGELIECPECGEAWAWELCEDGTLLLLPDEDDEIDETDLLEDVEDDEEDDE